MVEIRLDETYWIKSSRHSWDLCREHYVKNPETGKSEKRLLPFSFHATVKAVTHAYLEKSLKDSDATSIKELIAVADKCQEVIESLFDGTRLEGER